MLFIVSTLERYSNLSFLPFPCISKVLSIIFISFSLIEQISPMRMPVEISKSIIAKSLVPSKILKLELAKEKEEVIQFNNFLTSSIVRVFGNVCSLLYLNFNLWKGYTSIKL